MDFNKLVARVKGILTTPKTEWPVIGAEPATVADLYKNYIIWLAAIGPVVLLLTSRSLFVAVLMYLLSLALTYVFAVIIDVLAPTFASQRSQVQALKTVAYAWTAVWIAGIAYLVPFLGGLIRLAAVVYSIYLLYLALPHTMKTPPEKAGGYTAVALIVSFVLWLITASVLAMVTIGTGALIGGAAMHSLGSLDTPAAPRDDTALGKLDAWSKKMEAAGKQMEAAQKSGDAKAQSEALGKVIGTAVSGGDEVEALAPDLLKPFIPDTLAGLKRTEFSAEKNGAMGMQVSEAHATYSDGANRSLKLEVTDTGSAKGFLALAGFAAVQADKETDHGYEKTYKQNGNLVHEQWDAQTKYGEYGVILGDRFSVKVSGNADSMDQLKTAVASINLAGLAALKDVGVKKG